jgi:hypothetical protein
MISSSRAVWANFSIMAVLANVQAKRPRAARRRRASAGVSRGVRLERLVSVCSRPRQPLDRSAPGDRQVGRGLAAERGGRQPRPLRLAVGLADSPHVFPPRRAPQLSCNRGLAGGPPVFPLRRAPQLSCNRELASGPHVFLLRRAPELSCNRDPSRRRHSLFGFSRSGTSPPSLRSCTGQRPDSSLLLAHRTALSPGRR